MKTVWLLVCFALPLLAHGQTVQAVDETAAVRTSGAFFALSVSDLEASAKWYSDKLGLKTTMQVPKGPEGTAVKVLAGGGLIVELVQIDKAMPLSKIAPAVTATEQVHGIFKVGVIVDDLDQTIATLKARDVSIFLGPWPARETSIRNLIVKDNAGNLIQFFGRK